jgi:hypothetical protein
MADATIPERLVLLDADDLGGACLAMAFVVHHAWGGFATWIDAHTGEQLDRGRMVESMRQINALYDAVVVDLAGKAGQ